MNDSWTTFVMTQAMLANRKAPDEVSHSDINALMGKRRYGSAEDAQPFTMNPPVPAHSADEMAELQEFCAKRGIIGVNFNGMNPSAVLRMLKAKMGITEQTSKRGILNG